MLPKSTSITNHKYPFLVVIGLFFMLVQNPMWGQIGPGGAGGGNGDRIEGKFKFIPLPYVNYDTSYGISGGFVPMAMFNLSEKDTISPSSRAGMFGMYAENKTWFVMAFGMFYLDEDNWRVTIAGGTGDNNFQFYVDDPIDTWIPYKTGVNFFYISGQRKIIDGLYGGLNYMYTSFLTEVDEDGIELPESEEQKLHGLGLEFTYDKRSSVQYPRSGYLINLDYSSYPDFLGNKQTSNQISFDANYYHPTRSNRDVWASRAFAGIGIGDMNFNQQFIVGDPDIRGYSKGQYRGDYLLAVQSEYRYNFTSRIGAVGFAGLATVFGSNNKDDDGKLLPGVGAGFRYVFMKDTHSTVGFDVAKGDGDWGFYFRLSEAF